MRGTDVDENEGDVIKQQTSKALFNGSTNNKIKIDKYTFENRGHHITFLRVAWARVSLKIPKGVTMYIQGNKTSRVS